ncbi:hypothetical protein IT774_04190 [Salinimonas marina]|uniref:Uncharacterized protein n=1 Tax=Salinimonas marina TaxID=2785918 RepID=A0A7S9DYU3_9ALTE|nr:hypothetical protein [Salinimonas marina]QPG06398.1 hypothetical protein IT774_04190 [Salinimonas marina]
MPHVNVSYSGFTGDKFKHPQTMASQPEQHYSKRRYKKDGGDYVVAVAYPERQRRLNKVSGEYDTGDSDTHYQ